MIFLILAFKKFNLSECDGKSGFEEVEMFAENACRNQSLKYRQIVMTSVTLLSTL